MNDTGMTKIELLIIGLIIGALGLVATFAVTTARARTRDTTRLAHIRELQDALESFYSDSSTYPTSTEFMALGQPTTLCLAPDDGFACSIAPDGSYLEVVPTPPPQGLDEQSSCSGVDNTYCFQSSGTAYRIQFELEKGNEALNLAKGLNCATEEKLVSGACSSLAQ